MKENKKDRMYKVGDIVYIGHVLMQVKNQRGKLYVNYRGKQVNVKDIPCLPTVEYDCVFDYIFGGSSVYYPCPAMEFWIYRHRMGNRITTKEYAIKFKIKRSTF